MSDMTLKQMLNEVLSMSAFIKKSAFVSSNDVDDQQMVAVANRVLHDIVSHYNWGKLRKPYDIQFQTNQYRYALPPDFRSLVPDSIWERDGIDRVEINVPDDRWYSMRFGGRNSGINYKAKLFGNEIEFAEIDVGQIVTLEYLSSYAVQDDVAANQKARFTSDTDKFLLDDQLLMLGIQVAWGETKMLPQTGLWGQAYSKKLNEAVAREAGGETIGGCTRRERGNAPYTPTYVR